MVRLQYREYDAIVPRERDRGVKVRRYD